MTAEIYKGSNLRAILDTETDADSPISETLMNAVRFYSENIIILTYSTGDTGSATSDPPNDATGVLTDTGAAYDVDEHNGRTLIITSGNAVGNIYTIDDTTATTLVCTGDNLYSDGVRSGDDYEVFYDLLVNKDGHDHDGTNSSKINASIDQTALKTSMSAVGTAAGGANLTLPGGEYGFYPQVKGDFSGISNFVVGNIGASYVTNIYLIANSGTVNAQQRYVTASGEVHWIFILKSKKDGSTISTYEAPDHPCFGNGNRPKLVQHPFPDYDSELHEMIVINPTLEMVGDATARTIPIVGGGYLTAETLKANKYEVDDTRPERGLIEVFNEDFEIIESKTSDWPDMPVTVGLPRILNGEVVNDYRFKVGELVTPLKSIITKPDYITPLEMRLKDVK